MGTDRSFEYEGPCPCGEGKVTIDHCTPDHGYSVSVPVWYETRIGCKACGPKFDVEQRDKSFVFVEVAEVKAKAERMKELDLARAQLLKDNNAAAAVANFGVSLDKFNSVAAIHRHLSNNGLCYQGIATFRKSWSSGSRWVQRHHTDNDVIKIMQLAGVASAELLASLAVIDAEYKELKKPAAAVGPVFHTA